MIDPFCDFLESVDFIHTDMFKLCKLYIQRLLKKKLQVSILYIMSNGHNMNAMELFAGHKLTFTHLYLFFTTNFEFPRFYRAGFRNKETS